MKAMPISRSSERASGRSRPGRTAFLGLLSLVSACATPHGAGVGQGAGTACGPVIAGPSGDGQRPAWIAIAGQRELAVSVAGAETAMAGQMIATRMGPAFRPAFPFTPGLRYRVRGASCERTFAYPAGAARAPAPSVVEIFPTSQTIAENVLRFYIYFSEPMAEGDFLDHIRLENVSAGEDLSGVFFDNMYELWSADRKRITLLVDPGRVKTGLRANLARGRAFRAGETYALHVLPTWRSLRGQPLEKGFARTFRAVAEDRARVDPESWTLRLPEPGTSQPLIVEFAEPVDHVSVNHFIRVIDDGGNPLDGRWHLDGEDTVASFTPDAPWPPTLADHGLRIDNRFEDIVGNNVNGAFDHARGELRSQTEGGWVVRRFR